jgi:hypothetical protein
MKHSLPHRPLRFATAQAYDASLRGPGRFWVERSAEEYSLDEPIRGSHVHERAADAAAPDNADTAERVFIHDKSGVVCTNPLRDEPSPIAVGAVKRFGLVGLVTVAVGAGIARWWNSLSNRNH